MRTCVACAVVLLGASVAAAQPGTQAPATQPPQLMITGEEAELLQIGDISDGQRIGGGIAALSVGFGIGQAIQGRWSSDGWKFTLGEGAGGAVAMYGVIRVIVDCPLTPGLPHPCHSNGVFPLIAGAVVFGVFRIWGTYDAFTEPPKHNARLRALRMRLGIPEPQPYYGITPFVAPTGQGGGAIAGVALGF